MTYLSLMLTWKPLVSIEWKDAVHRIVLLLSKKIQ
jgi:hypothetical protein